MLQTLDLQSRECGLKMNPDKTRVMTNSEPKPVVIQSKSIAYAEDYVYLGQNISFKKHKLEEVETRIKKAWSAYWSLKHIFKSKLDNKLKKKAMDSVITPTLIYGCQTWAITNELIGKVQVFQRTAERSMLGIKLLDKIKSVDIRKKTKIIDAAELICRLKWRWAGHTARTTDGRWSEHMLHWYPRDGQRARGRPRRRWRDDIAAVAGVTWTRLATDRNTWHTMEEAYVHKWTSQ
jgi:hypothetical protein